MGGEYVHAKDNQQRSSTDGGVSRHLDMTKGTEHPHLSTPDGTHKPRCDRELEISRSEGGIC